MFRSNLSFLLFATILSVVVAQTGELISMPFALLCTDPVLFSDKPIKAGWCPILRPGTVGICVTDCQADADCPGKKKCCNNGCGPLCTDPVTLG
jgi:WAP-type (Whey Acidic Protein) 'four-disulfide core'